MKVLMFGWEFPPHIAGGLGTACYGLTKGLAKQQVEVLFVMPKATGDEDSSIGQIINASDVNMDYSVSLFEDFWKRIDFLEISSSIIPYLSEEHYQNMRTEDMKDGGQTHTWHLGGKFSFSGKYGANLMEEVARYAFVAAEIASKQEFDVIHAHDWLTYPAGIAAKQISGKPLVIHVHATEFDRSGENVNQSVYNIEKAGMEAADRVLTVSHLTRKIVIERYGIDESKVITVHNAVDFTGHHEVNVDRTVDEKVVTFLGRITFQKGPEYFIEAAKKVLVRNPNVRFVMAGSGDMMNRMVRRVAKLGMGTKFHFTGFLKGQEVQEMFAYSDVYVMPSVSEPFGISPLEAVQMGVPVIISKQSGVAEVLTHALKVNFWDVDALADCIYNLLEHPVLPDMLVRYGKEEVDSFKWEKVAHVVKQIYQTVV